MPIYKQNIKNGECSVDNEKSFNVRMPKQVHTFLRRYSVDTETSMNAIIVECLEKYKKNIEKKVDAA